MRAPTLKVLVTGDLHLGRRCASLPAELAADPRFSAAAMWRRMVEAALAEEVDALALTGDVVDRENRFFEALGPLEEGLRRLAEAGIDTVAVAGNHDFDALPRLADQMRCERFHLLGRGGAWERKVLHRAGRPVLVVEGWSFPRQHVPADPLEARDLPRPQGAEADLPVLALLHTELGATDSPYAPTSLAGLRLRSHVTAWLLGHAHAPHRYPGPEAPVLYPGSPLAFDAREPGCHGPWLLALEGRRPVALEQLPLSPVRYETVEVDLQGVKAREEVDGRFHAALRGALAQAAAEGGGSLELLVTRLRLTGATALPRSALALAFEKVGDLRLPHDDAVAVVIRTELETRPSFRLGELAAASGPPGALARTLQRLEAGEGLGEVDHLARAELGKVHAAGAYQRLGTDPAPDETEVRRHLLAAGYKLLDALLAQKEGRP